MGLSKSVRTKQNENIKAKETESEKKKDKEKTKDGEKEASQIEKPVQRRGSISKLYVKAAGRLGFVEMTELDEVFKKNMDRLEDYRLCVDEVLDALEGILQPNVQYTETGLIVAPEGLNPFEKMSLGIQKLALPAGTAVASLVDVFNKLATEERATQKKSRNLLLRQRRFVTLDYDKMVKDKEELDNIIINMDSARHEVRNAKVMEVLEENGRNYAKEVKNFNEKGLVIQQVIDELPTMIYRHQRETVKFFDERRKFHEFVTNQLKSYHNPVSKILTSTASNISK